MTDMEKMGDAQIEAAVEASVDRALAAFTELMSLLVVAGQFGEVQRLSPIGAGLQRVKKQTVADYLRREQQQNGGDFAADLVMPYQRGIGGNLVAGGGWGGGNDVGNLQRELLLMLQKVTDQGAGKQDAGVAAQEAEELRTLQDILDRAPRGRKEDEPLRARVTMLIDKIGERALPKKEADR